MKCHTGKLQFKTRNEAVGLNKITGKKSGEYFNIYHCTWCGDWHFASRSNNKKVKRFNRL